MTGSDASVRNRSQAKRARMRYGITMFATDVSIDIVELAREAEARGLQSLWLPEHTHIPTSRRTPPPTGDAELAEEYKRCLDPLVALAAAAVRHHHPAARHRHPAGRPARADRHGQGRRHPRPPERRPGRARRRLRLERGRARAPRRRDGATGGPWPARRPRHAGALGRRRGQLRRRARAVLAELVVAEAGAARRRRPAPRAGAARRRAGPEAVRPHRRVRRRLDPDRRRRPHRRHPAAARGGGRGRPRSRAASRSCPFGSIPDPGKLDHFERIGVTECVFRLPSAPRDVVLPLLDEQAALVASRA